MLAEIEDYYWIMAARHRLLRATSNGVPCALCTFLVAQNLREVTRYYARPAWSVPAESSGGSVIYIDHLVGLEWNRELFRLMEAEMSKLVPAWQTAVWYRPGVLADRRHIYRRRDADGEDV